MYRNLSVANGHNDDHDCGRVLLDVILLLRWCCIVSFVVVIMVMPPTVNLYVLLHKIITIVTSITGETVIFSKDSFYTKFKKQLHLFMKGCLIALNLAKSINFGHFYLTSHKNTENYRSKHK